MIKKIVYISVFIFLLFQQAVFSQVNKTNALANDQCSGARLICKGATTSTTNIGANAVGDPATSCGDAVAAGVWYYTNTYAAGDFSVTISGYTGSLTIEIFDGTAGCGSLSSIACASGASTKTVSVTGATAGKKYYILVDGVGANKVNFNIDIAITSGAANVVEGIANPVISVSPSGGCAPFTAVVDNQTLTNGTSENYDWYIFDNNFTLLSTVANTTGADTTFYFPSTGQYIIGLGLNNSCLVSGFTSTQIGSQILSTSITPDNDPICKGTPVGFTPNAVLSPAYPSSDPHPYDWSWDFGDPASGVNNTDVNEFPSHTFVGTGPNTTETFTVTLITQADCGPDTTTYDITIVPEPISDPNGPLNLCLGTDPELITNPTRGTSPYTITWSGGAGTITSPNNDSTTVTGLAVGSYTYALSITDAMGCIFDSVVDVTLNTSPTIVASTPTAMPVCPLGAVSLIATPAGTAPYQYFWFPSTYLNDASLANPTANVPSSMYIYVYTIDATGCTSDTDSVSIVVNTPPSYSYPFVCASSPSPTTDVTMTGAGVGSTFQWYLSPDFNLISGTNAVDSTIITIDFTGQPAGDYDFIVLSTDGVTGCLDTVVVTVTLSAGITMSVSGPSEICSGLAANISASGPTSYLWTSNPADPSLIGQTTLASISVIPPSVTTYDYIVEGTTGSCTVQDTLTVVVNPLPAVTASVSADTICIGGTSILTAAGAITYVWSSLPFDVSTTGQTTESSMTVNPTINTQYCVNGADAKGCTKTRCKNVIIRTNSSLNAGADSTICENDSIMLTGSGGTTYIWYKLPANVLVGASTSVDVAPVISTNYFVQSDISGCTFRDTIAITVNPIPAVNITQSTDTVCTGSALVMSTTGSDVFAWSSIPADGSLAGQQTNSAITVFPIFNTTYSVTVTDTVSLCADTKTASVVTQPSPSASVATPDTICGCGTDTVDGTGSTTAMQYLWTSTTGTFTDSASLITTLNFCSSATVTLTVTNPATNCSSSANTTAVSKALPDAVFTTSPTQFCGGTSITVTLDGTGSAVAGATYSWTSDVPFISIADSFALNTTAVINQQTIFYLTVNKNGCDSVYQDTVKAYPSPVVLASPGSLCIGDILMDTLAVTGAGIGSVYDWSLSSALPTITGYDATDSIAYVDFTLFGAGLYDYAIEVTDGITGCTDTVNFTFTVFSNVLSLSISSDTSICDQDSAQLNISGAATYVWTSSPADPSLNGQDSISNPKVAPSVTTTYYVTGHAGSCFADDSVTVTVNPIPTITLGNDTSICRGDILALSGSGGISLDWFRLPTNNYLGNAVAILVAPVNTTSYYAQGTLSGCTNTDTINITVNTLPIINITASDDTICGGEQVFFSLIGATTYLWSSAPVDASLTGQTTLANPIVSPSITTTYTIEGTDATTGCDNTVTFQVVVNPKPVAVMDSINDICSCQDVVLDGTGSTTSLTYLWTATTGTIAADTDLVTTAHICNASTIKIIVTDTSTGCADTASMAVVKLTQPTAKNSVTPSQFCSGIPTIVTLSGSGSTAGATYHWASSPAATIADTTAMNTTATVIQTTVFTFTVTQAGCDSVVTDTAATYSIPTVSSNPASLCTNDVLTAAFTVNGAAAVGTTYDWSTSPSLATITGYASGNKIANVNFTAFGAGTYNYVIIVTDGITGCSDTVNYSFTVFSNVISLTTSNDTSICLRDTAQITISGAASYAWTSAPVDASLTGQTTQDTLNLFPSATTNYYVTASAGSCTKQDTVKITILSLPVVSAGIDATICSGSSSTLTGSGGTTYIWYSLPGSAFVANTQSTSVSPVLTTSYYVSGTTGSCSNTDTVKITVKATPSVVITATFDSICSGSSTLLQATGANTYLWSALPADATLVGQTTSASPTVSPTVTTTYTVVGTNTATGCTNTQTQIIVVNPGLTAVITPIAAICGCSSVTLDGTGSTTSNTQFQWTSALGSSIASSTTLSTTAFVCGNDILTLTATDTVGGCTAAATANITYYSKPNVDFTISPAQFCSGISTTITLTGTAAAGQTYLWTSNPVVSIASPSSLSTTADISSQTIFSLTVTDSNGCDSTYSDTAKTYPAPTVSPSPASLCASDILLDTLTLLTPAAGSTIDWSASPDIATITGYNVSKTIAYVDYTAFGAGTYDYVITVNDAVTGCTDLINYSFTVFPSILNLIISNDATICQKDTIELTISGAATYSWTALPLDASLAGQTTYDTLDVFPSATTTYTVVGSAGSCTATKSVKVTVLPLPVLNLGPDTEICQGTVMVLNATGGGSYEWYQLPQDSLISVSQILVKTLLTNKIYYVKVTGVNGCINRDTINIIVDDIPNLASSIEQDTMCIHDTITISATGTISYLWTANPADATLVPQQTDSIVNVSPTTTTTYTLNGSTGACTIQHTYTLNVKPGPTVTVNVSSNTICSASLVTLTAAGAVGYLWTATPADATLTGQENATTINVNPLVTTQYCAKGTDAEGCYNITCKTITTLPLPTPNAGNDTTVCEDDNATLVASGGLSYQWYTAPNDSSISSDSIVNTIVSDTTDYYVVATAANGCTNNDTVRVNIIPFSGVTISISDDTLCIGENTVFTASGADTYSWTAFPLDPTLSIAESTSPTIDVTPLATTIYTLVMSKNATGCDKQFTYTIPVYGFPVADAAPIGAKCGCDPVTLDGSASDPALDYLWISYSGNASITSPTNQSTPAVVCQADTFEIIVTNPFSGCTSVDTNTVSIKPKPNATASASPSQFCMGVATFITLTATVDSAVSIIWTANPPATIADSSQLVTTATITQATDFSITLTGPNGCDTTITKSVTAYPSPTLIATPNSFCSNDPPLNLVMDILGASVGSTYNWFNVPACISPNTIGNVSSQALNFDACPPGFHTFQIEVTDAFTTCVDTVTKGVMISDSVYLVFDPVGPITICENDSLSLSAQGAFNFYWSTGDSTIGDTISTVQVCPGLPSGINNVVLTGITGNCIAADTVVVNVIPLPVANSGGNTTSCLNDTLTLTATNAGVGAIYEWYALPQDSLVSNTQSATIVHASIGTFTYYLKVNQLSCLNYDTFTVTVYAHPSVTITASDDTICYGDPVTLIANPTGNGPFSYLWDDINATTTQIASPIVTANTTFCVTLTDNSTGCTDTACHNEVSRALPIVVASSSVDTSCQSDNVSLFASGTGSYDWAKITSPGISLGTLDTITVSPNSSTCYVLTGTDTTTGCSNKDTICIIVNKRPTANAGTDQSICESGAANLSDAVTTNGSIIWTTSGNGIFSDSSIQNPIYTPGNSDPGNTISLTLTVSNSPCPDAVSVTHVAVEHQPIAVIDTAYPNPVCSGDTVHLAGTASYGTILWTTNGVGLLNNNTSSMPYYISAIADVGIKNIYMTVTGTLGVCSPGKDTLQMDIRGIPTANAGVNDTICEGDVKIFSDATAINGAIIWANNGDGVFDDSTLVKPSYFHGTNDVGSTIWFTITVTNAPCPLDEDTSLLTIDPAPVATIDSISTDTVCLNDYVTLYGSSLNALNGVKWTDGNAGGTFTAPTSNTTLYYPPNVGNINIYFTVTGSASCAPAKDTVKLVVEGLPVAVAGSNYPPICENTPLTLNNATAAFGNVKWSTSGFGTFDDSTLTNPTYTPNTKDVGFITLTMIVYNTSCPADTDTTILQVSPAPTSKILSVTPNPVCEGVTINVVATSTNDINGNIWTDSNGLGTFGNTTDSSTTYISGASGNITLYYTATGSAACTPAVDSVILVVKAKPYAFITSLSQDTACQGTTISINDSVGNGTIKWLTTGTGSFNTLDSTYTPGATELGNIFLSVSVTNAPCPAASATKKLVVIDKPDVSIDPSDTSICFADTLTITATVNTSSSVTYQWNDITLPNLATVEVSPTDTTLYILSVITAGCTITDSSLVKVIPPGIPNAGLDTLFCSGEKVILSGTVQNATQVKWTTNGAGTFSPDNTSLSTSYTPTTNESKGDTLWFSLTSTDACYNLTDTVLITIMGQESVNAGADQAISIGATAQLHGKIAGGGSGKWTSSGTGVFSPNDSDLNAKYIPSQDDYNQASITITLTSTSNCTTTFDFMLLTIEPMSFPTVMTPYPGSPGQNDYLIIGGIEPGLAQIIIFNKWGKEVFEAANYRNDWDASNVESNVYYYIVKYKDTEWSKWIMIIKDEK